MAYRVYRDMTTRYTAVHNEECSYYVGRRSMISGAWLPKAEEPGYESVAVAVFEAWVDRIPPVYADCHCIPWSLRAGYARVR